MTDNETIEKLVSEYGEDVYRFCGYLTSNRDLTEDLYQETFLKAAQLRDKFQDSKNCKSYLFSIAANLWKNHLHKKLRRKAILQQVDFDDGVDQFPDCSTDPSEEYAEKELLRKTRETVDSLDSRQKTVIVLYYGESLSVKEISKILHIPKGTVMSRLSKARENIRKKLEENGYETRH